MTPQVPQTRPASAQTLRPGSAVKALRAALRFSLWPGVVVAVDSPPYWQRSKVAHVTVEFSDDEQQTYSGAGISDYVLELVEQPTSARAHDCNSKIENSTIRATGDVRGS